MTRTDVHRPSEINPEDYSYIAPELIRIEGLGDCMAVQVSRERIRQHMKATGGKYSTHAHGGNCHICGNANAVYTHLFYHAPTNTYIRTGEDCAAKLDDSVDGSEFRSAVKGYREAKAGKAKAQAFLSDAGLSAAWAVWEAVEGGSKWEEATISDIVGKLIRYGSISDKQVAFIAKLLEKIENRDRIAAEREAEREAAKPIPAFTGRVKIEGEILSMKTMDTFYGTQIKMVIRHADGWKLYGTAPAALVDALDDLNDGSRGIGHKVEFEAAVKVSEEDKKFGFFSRPTKAKVAATA